MDININK